MEKIQRHNYLLDLNRTDSEKNSKYININSALSFYKFKLFFIQNCGIIIGFWIMTVIALYGESIGNLVPG